MNDRCARAERRGDDGVGRLAEEDRRFACRIATHFLDVVGIVAADAIDAMHRKNRVVVDDGHNGLRGGSDNVAHGGSLEKVWAEKVKDRIMQNWRRDGRGRCGLRCVPWSMAWDC
jgi:hypothetical protein